MLRTLLFLILALPFAVLSPLLWLIILISRSLSQKAGDRIAFRCLQFILRIARFSCGIRLECEGLENLPDSEPALVVLNHRSIFDIVVVYVLLKHPAGFIGKIELKKIPLLRQWFEITHGLFLDRSNLREGLKTILKGVEYLKAGYSMCICPEGTRNQNSEDLRELLPFHAGSFKLSEKSGVPIVPMVIYNTAACFEDHIPRLRRTVVQVRILPPIRPEALEPADRRQLADYVRNKMQAALNTCR